MNWTGLFTATVTPFSADGKHIAYDTFEKLIERQIEGGADGIVVLGTTGESPTIHDDEARRLLELATRTAAGRTRIIAGISGNDTRHVLQDVSRAAECGVDGIMVAAPYYNKPSQDGLFAHYAAIAEATHLPVMVYNIPGRTGVNIGIDTLRKLHATYPHIGAVKEASGDYQQIADTVHAFTGTAFRVLSGDDSMVLPVMALGGSGVVSVLSNLMPADMKMLVQALADNDKQTAAAHYFELLPLMRGIFIGGNPGGIKTLMAQDGLLEASYRLPLYPPTPEEQKKILSLRVAPSKAHAA